MIEKILKLSNSIPHDKALHGYYGLMTYVVLNLFIPCGVAFMVVVVLALGKEWYDYSKPNTHTSDSGDALFTVAVPFVVCVMELLYESFS